ncbi:hypothetical protein Plhal304r1_c006g0022711 [Plasmopara halstedii]
MCLCRSCRLCAVQSIDQTTLLPDSDTAQTDRGFPTRLNSVTTATSYNFVNNPVNNYHSILSPSLMIKRWRIKLNQEFLTCDTATETVLGDRMTISCGLYASAQVSSRSGLTPILRGDVLLN